MAHQFVPAAFAIGVALLFTTFLLGAAALISQRPRSRSALKRDTYESGLPLIDASRKRIAVKFYTVALVFVVLDVEVAFLYPWAVTYRSLLAKLGPVVLLDMLAFIVLLGFAYAYLWREGAFDWHRGGQR